MKRIISLLLAAMLVLSLAACGAGAAVPAQSAEPAAEIAAETPAPAPAEPSAEVVQPAVPAADVPAVSDIDLQLNLLYSQISGLKQDASRNTWYYSVTDLDHDGNLELVAASLHPLDRSTNLAIWEVSADRVGLSAVQVVKDEDESFPDIMTDAADCYHDASSDTWSYVFYDNLVISDYEVYTVKTAVTMKDGAISYKPLAIQHLLVGLNTRTVDYMDASGLAISPEAYNAAGTAEFASCERSSTSFAWLTAADLDSQIRLTDSYAVFSGAKAPTQVFPVPRPAALSVSGSAAAATPAPVVTPVPTPKAADEIKYLMITKNPTNENKKVGGKALFVACANAFESLSWTLVSPTGGEYSVPNFRSYFNADVSGEYSTTLAIANVTADMDGWGAYCTFYYKGQSLRTTTAYIYVKGESSPVPQSGSLEGYVTEILRNSVTFEVPGVDYYTLDISSCTVEGNLAVGAPATLYYNSRGARGVNVVNATIHGKADPVVPDGGVATGSVVDWTYSNVNVEIDGTIQSLFWDIVELHGDIYAGAPATVTWQGTTTKGLNYTSCVIEGRHPAPVPEYGSMSGTAHEGGAGFAITLMDGSQVFVDGWICNVMGVFYDGAPCSVYYTGEVTSDSIYKVDIYGSSPEPDPAPAPIPEPDPAPVSGSAEGRAFDNLDGRVVVFLDNGDTLYVERTICTFHAEVVVAGAGNPCKVFYIGEPSQDGVYSVEIFEQDGPLF